MRTHRHNAAMAGTRLSLARRALALLRKHRVVTSLTVAGVVFAVFGHHELTWLLVATRADKVIETVIGD